MRAILPGRPNPTRQALSTANWDGLRLVSYVLRNAVVILDGPHNILQTLYIDEATTLSAVTIDETSGRLATCSHEHVYVYDPSGRDEGILRWTLLYALEYDTQATINCLSWGSSEELLVSGSDIRLWNFQQAEHTQIVWRQQVSNEIEQACMSHDAGIIASYAKHDRLVKIWRRLSYEVDSTRFDVSYLPHPTTVINVHWRKPWHTGQSLDNLLYTFCADQQIRVWDYGDTHSLSVMQLVATIDTKPSIQPRRLSTGSVSQKRYAFIIDSRDFAAATEKAVQTTTTEGVDHALEHLIEVANRTPEVCVVMDGLGHMSAWGIENAGYKNRQPATTFNIVHVDGMNLNFPQNASSDEDYIVFHAFAGALTDSSISLLLHSYTGQIDWYDTQLKDMLDTASRNTRVKLQASWSGHNHQVSSVVYHEDVLLSRTDQGEVLIWKHQDDTLTRQSTIQIAEEIIDALPFKSGGFIAILTSRSLYLFDGRRSHATRASSTTLKVSSQPLFLLWHVKSNQIPSDMSIGVLYDDGTCVQLSLHLEEERGRQTNGIKDLLKYLETSKAGLPTNPSHIIRCYTRAQPEKGPDSAIALDRNNLIHGLDFSRAATKESKVHWRAMHQSLPVLKKHDVASVSANGKLALVSEDQCLLRIWDIFSGHCEFEYTARNSESIQGVHWHLSQFGHLLALAWSSFQIVVFGQCNYGDSPCSFAWTEVYRIRTRDFSTHALSAVSWSKNGDIVVGVGNQLFVLDTTSLARTPDKVETVSQQSLSLARALDIRNSLLPVFHDAYLHYLMDVKGCRHIRNVLKTLHQKLKFFSEGDNLDSFIDSGVLSVTGSSPEIPSDDLPNGKVVVNGSTDTDEPIQEDVVEALAENIEKHRLWQISSSTQDRLENFIRYFPSLDTHFSSLDANALRYLHALYNSNYTPLPWSAMSFASHSTTQEPLLPLIHTYYSSKLTWQSARNAGIFLWLSSPESLQTQMDLIAKTEYTSHEDRNPISCSLYYLALRKKSVLQGLWRMTIGVRERENTMKLLANNFDLPRWKATAQKNAYALLSKRRFEYAAAWFLLADSLKDAVNVCVNQMNDVQLGVAIARVYGGDENNTVLTSLLRDVILEQAPQSTEGRWIASWAYTFLGEHERALQVLVRPVWQVVGINLNEYKGDGYMKSMHYTADNPLLALLYVQLRENLCKQGKWKEGVLNPGEETRFVMRCARYYIRMSLDVFGLDLVRNWVFVMPESAKIEEIEEVNEAGDDGEKEAEEDVIAVKDDTGKGREEKKGIPPPPPTQFVEPSSSDLLDNFGF